MLEFASECPVGALRPHKLSDKVVLEVGRVPETRDDLTLWDRQPWSQRSWLRLIEVVRHFGVLEEQSKTLQREAKAF